MRRVLMCQCEKCGNLYRSEHEAILCEANHLNLSIEEYTEYQNLKRNAACLGADLYTIHNEETVKKYDIACEELTEFEIAHHIK